MADPAGAGVKRAADTNGADEADAKRTCADSATAPDAAANGASGDAVEAEPAWTSAEWEVWNREQSVAEWHFHIGEDVNGPYTTAMLRSLVRIGRIHGGTPVWRRGDRWHNLEDVVDLKGALVGGADEAEGAEEAKRPPLEDLPITHSYTDERGELWVWDRVEHQWRGRDDYQTLVEAEQEQEEARTSLETPLTMEEMLARMAEEPAPAPSSAAAGVANGAPAAAAAAPGTEASADAAAAEDPEAEAKRLKAEKKKAYRDRKKLKKQAGVWQKARENPNVYVSGLPLDITQDELAEMFKRAGVLKISAEDGKPRVRLYTTPSGAPRGDGLVTYANVESVELAIKFLHEHEIRGTRLCVQAAEFTEKEHKTTEELAELAKGAVGRKELMKKRKAARALQEREMSWSTEVGARGTSTVVIKGAFEAGGDSSGVESACREACEVFGELKALKVLPVQGLVCVKFKQATAAEAAIPILEAEPLNGRSVTAFMHDGSDLRAFELPSRTQQPAWKRRSAAAADAPADAQAADGAPDNEKDEDSAESEEENEDGDGEAGPGTSWDDWLDDQSSDDDIGPVRTEED